MSLTTLFSQTPELLTPKATVGDVADAVKMRADYESNAPTGGPISDIPWMEQFLIGVKTTAGQIVTPERAKRVATVLAIIRGLSEDVSSLHVDVMKRGEQEDTQLYDHPVHRILNVSPNEYMTALELREHIMWDTMLWGGFFNILNYADATPGGNTGGLLGVWPLQAGYVTRRWRESVWTFTDPLTGIAGTIDTSNSWRGTINSPNGLDGVAITLLAREAIGILQAAEEQGARLFAHGVQTDLVLESPEEVDDPTKAQLRQAFMERHSGSNQAFMPMIMSGGLQAKRIGLTAVESQYIESRRFQIEEIARVFRYPEVLLGSSTSGKSSTYASAEQFFESYTKHTLTPWTVRIEQTIQRDLLNIREKSRLFVQHNFDSLLKANQNGRFTNYNLAINGGWMQPAEARRKERLKYYPGLDYFNKPAGSTGQATQPGGGPAGPDGSDQSALAIRVAYHILAREEKAKARVTTPERFYTDFAEYIQSITGCQSTDAKDYVLHRQSNEDGFSPESRNAALLALVALCGGHNAASR